MKLSDIPVALFTGSPNNRTTIVQTMKFLKVGGAVALGVAGWVAGAHYERLRRSVEPEERIRHLPGLPFGAVVSAATAVPPSGMYCIVQ